MWVNILKSVDEGPFKMEKFREILAEGAKGALHLGPERDRVFVDLTSEEKERFKADIRASNILLQGLPKDIYALINHYTDAKDIWDNVKMLLEGSELTKDERESQLYNQHAIDPLALVSNVSPHQYPSQSSVIPQSTHTNTFDDDVDEAPVQDLALNKDNVFQADQCDTFDSDVDKAPTAQTMFMANLSSTDLIYDEVGPSYDSDILSKVQYHDNYVDSVGEYHKVHEMQNYVQPNYVIDSDVEYMSDSNSIPYEPYVKDNTVKVVQSNVSYVPNDALMMIINNMHEQFVQCVSANKQNKVVNESLTAELARYKEQVQLYEKRARFELTEREQKINEQMRIIIRDRNVQEELLKKELHSVKMELNSTINHNKLIKEEVTTLKQDFKQKENKYLEEFLDMKQLK
ncbi:hypothetical protein Tco_1097812 [Tanacetum coccineum]